MNAVVYPSRLVGTVFAPPSKSDAHRALIAAACADAPTIITFSGGASALGEDILCTADCLRALGADVRISDGAMRVTPGRAVGASVLDCGESGATLRFLLPVLAARGVAARFVGRGRLPERPIADLLETLTTHGCTVRADGFRRQDGALHPKLPFTLDGRLTGGNLRVSGGVSSQYVSGLLLAAPLLETDTRLHIEGALRSRPYVDMTVRTMRRFGIEVFETADGYAVRAGGYRTSGGYALEGDWSSAAVFVAAKTLGHDVAVEGLASDSLQPDMRCAVLCGTVGGGAVLDVSDCPDLLPVLAVRAAFAEGETRFVGAARLRHKESDRLGALVEGLTALGVRAEECADGLTVHGGAVNGGAVDAHGDHRLVMAWTLAAVGAKRPVTIYGIDAVGKSYPTFFDDLIRLGGRLDVIA